MLYNEEYILSQIRDLQSQGAYLNSMVGYLVSIIKSVGSGGGVGNIMHGPGLPSAPPPDPTAAALWIDDNTQILYPWNVPTQSWII